MESLIDLITFFGCTLNKVNPILLRISQSYRPDWLERCPKIYQLPRWNDKSDILVQLPDVLVPEQVGMRIIWIIEEMHGGWKLTTDGFHFSDTTDAVYFKLRWF